MELTSSSRIVEALLAMALSLSAAGPVAAQENALAMELNSLSQTEAGCRLTFVIGNDLAGDLDKAVFEFALFDTSGLVERLLTLDFKELPQGKTRVRQFDLVDLECGGLARVLVNDARECTGDAVEPAACMRDLKTSTNAAIEFGS